MMHKGLSLFFTPMVGGGFVCSGSEAGGIQDHARMVYMCSYWDGNLV